MGLQNSSKFSPYSSSYVVSFVGCLLVLFLLLVALFFLSLCYSCYWSPSSSSSHVNCLFLFLVLVFLLLICPFPCVGLVASHFLPLLMFLILVLSFFSHGGLIVGRFFFLLCCFCYWLPFF